MYGVDPVLSGFVGLCGLYATPFFFLSFFREIFAVRDNLLLGRLQWLSGAFVVFSVVFSFVTPSGPLNLLLIFYVLAIVVFSSAIVFAIRKLKQTSVRMDFFLGRDSAVCCGTLGSCT